MSVSTRISSTAETNRLHNLEYILAGCAIFTVVVENNRFTYYFVKSKLGKNKGKMLARMLTGPDNTNDYQDLGIINMEKGDIELSGTYAIQAGKVLPHAALARYIVNLAKKNDDIPKEIKIYSCGCCLRCGRLLTSTDNPYFPYLGPECGQK